MVRRDDGTAGGSSGGESNQEESAESENLDAK